MFEMINENNPIVYLLIAVSGYICSGIYTT
jgi:hypothetical protein